MSARSVVCRHDLQLAVVQRRPVSLLEFTVEALNQHSKEQEKERALFGEDYQDNDLVCPLPDGSPWPPDSFSAQFRRFRDKCGLEIWSGPHGEGQEI